MSQYEFHLFFFYKHLQMSSFSEVLFELYVDIILQTQGSYNVTVLSNIHKCGWF